MEGGPASVYKAMASQSLAGLAQEGRCQYWKRSQEGDCLFKGSWGRVGALNCFQNDTETL